MTPDEKPVSPPGVPVGPRVQSCWYRERKGGGGHQGTRAPGLGPADGGFSTRTAEDGRAQPGQEKREGGRKVCWVGYHIPREKPLGSEVGTCVGPASPCRGPQRGGMSWEITGGKQDGMEGEKEEDKGSW